ncbi:MAG: hypothetical protein WC164_02330 [Patescibacteria group bacterium]
MKKFVYFSVIALFSLTLSACTYKTETKEPVISDNNIISLAESCESNSGTWLEDFSECEFVSENWCLENNGTFNECESACRHDEEAEMCILMCVPVCKL